MRRRFTSLLCDADLMYISALCLTSVLFLPSLRHPAALFADPDLGWHLADARLLFQTHHFVRADPYSWTVAGRRWIDAEWPAELPFWFGYKTLGAFGIYLATWALLDLNIGLAYFRARQATEPATGFVAAAMMIGLFLINCGPRTILAGYVLLSALLWLIEAYETRRTKLIWLTPPIFAVWINTHGTWVIGLFLLVLYWAFGYIGVAKGSIDQQKRDRSSQKDLLTVIGLSVAALFANPYGWRTVWSPFDMMFGQPLNIASVIEWQPLNLQSIPGRVATGVIAIMLLAAILRPRKWKAYEIAWLLFAWYAAFDHVRFVFLAGVVTAPFLARALESFWQPKPSRETRRITATFTVAAIALMVIVCPRPRKVLQAAQKDWPSALIQRVRPDWRTLNGYAIGGQLALEGRPDFVDSRAGLFERAGVLKVDIAVAHIKRPYEILNKYRVDHILFRTATPFGYLIAHSPGWKLIGQEGTWGLWARQPETADAITSEEAEAGRRTRMASRSGPHHDQPRCSPVLRP